MKYTLEQQKENRIKWAEALENGEYKQGRGWLREDDCFCCLGVACDLAGVSWVPEGFRGWVKRAVIGSYCDSSSLLGLPVVRGMFGLRSNGGHFRKADGTAASLADLNDGGTSFPEIAKIIRAEPEGLFVTDTRPHSEGGACSDSLH